MARRDGNDRKRCKKRSDRPGGSPQTGHEVAGKAEPGTRRYRTAVEAGPVGHDDKGSGGIGVGGREQDKGLAAAHGHSEPGRPGPWEGASEDGRGGGLPAGLVP